MPQQLFYGGFAFYPDATWFTIHKQAILGNTGRRKFVAETWHIDGRVNGTSIAEVSANAAALENALLDGGDLVFTLFHRLLSADCVEGTHVHSFTWVPGYDGTTRGSGAEMVLRRTFKLVISGKKIATGIDSDIIEYQETIVGRGTGGPLVLPVTSLYGNVQAQQRVAKTPFWSVQSGYAIGLTDYPLASSRMFLGVPSVYYMPEQVSEGLHTPQNWGLNQNTGYKINWSYLAWSPNAMVGQPLPF